MNGIRPEIWIFCSCDFTVNFIAGACGLLSMEICQILMVCDQQNWFLILLCPVHSNWAWIHWNMRTLPKNVFDKIYSMTRNLFRVISVFGCTDVALCRWVLSSSSPILNVMVGPATIGKRVLPAVLLRYLYLDRLSKTLHTPALSEWCFYNSNHRHTQGYVRTTCPVFPVIKLCDGRWTQTFYDEVLVSMLSVFHSLVFRLSNYFQLLLEKIS